MNSLAAALPMSSSPPAAVAQDKVSKGAASGLDALSNSDPNWAATFSALLADRISGQTATAPQPNKPTAGKSQQKDAAESTALGAIAAIITQTATPVSPTGQQSTPQISATKTGNAELSTEAATLRSTADTVPPTALPLPAVATNPSSDGISAPLQPNIQTPAGSPPMRLEPNSALLQGPTQTVPAASDAITSLENSVAGRDREQRLPKNASAPTATTASLVEAPRMEPTARSAGANSPPSLPDQIHDQMSARLEPVQQTGRVEAQFSLHPPELGRVQLHMTMEDNRLNVRMLVQDDNAKRLIEQQAEPLRVRFAEMGVSVGQFDVRRDGNSANPEKQQPAEPSAHALQPGSGAASGAQKSYAKVANSAALVDVLA